MIREPKFKEHTTGADGKCVCGHEHTSEEMTRLTNQMTGELLAITYNYHPAVAVRAQVELLRMIFKVLAEEDRADIAVMGFMALCEAMNSLGLIQMGHNAASTSDKEEVPS